MEEKKQKDNQSSGGISAEMLRKRLQAGLTSERKKAPEDGNQIQKKQDEAPDEFSHLLEEKEDRPEAAAAPSSAPAPENGPMVDGDSTDMMNLWAEDESVDALFSRYMPESAQKYATAEKKTPDDLSNAPKAAPDEAAPSAESAEEEEKPESASENSANLPALPEQLDDLTPSAAEEPWDTTEQPLDETLAAQLESIPLGEEDEALAKLDGQGSEEEPLPSADFAADIDETDADASHSEETAGEKPEDADESTLRDIDDTDMQLMLAFGMEDELAKTVGSEKAMELESEYDTRGARYEQEESRQAQRKKKKEETQPEYTSETQNAEIRKKYQKEYQLSLLKLLAGAILTVLIFAFENSSMLGIRLPNALNSSIYPVVHVMADLQLFLLCAVLALPQFLTGWKYLVAGKPTTDSVLSLTVSATLLYHGLLAVTSAMGTIGVIRMYDLPAALCIMAALLGHSLNLMREIYSFNIVGSKHPKYGLQRMTAEDAEAEIEAFSDFFSREPSIFHIKRAKFVDSFYKRMRGATEQTRVIRILLAVCGAASICFMLIQFALGKPVTDVLAAGELTLLLCLPISAFFALSYPFYRANKVAYEVGGTIVGEHALEEYSAASAISFEDHEVFPAAGVKVRSVKTYGSQMIDSVIYTTASLFMKLGGPLADVFAVAVKDHGCYPDVEVHDLVSGGIEATVHGVHVYVGKAGYLVEKGFRPPYDREDAAIENKGDLNIMFVAMEEEVAAKMYIQYRIDASFEKTLQQLYRNGMCVGIKTFDPNIDERMLSMRIRVSKYPVKILRCHSVEDMDQVMDRLDSGIVSKRSAKSLMQTYNMCGKVLHALHTGTVLKVIAMMFGFLLISLSAFVSRDFTIGSLFTAIYQLVWSLMVCIIGRLCVGSIQ